ncbi:hypothetical protein [Cryptosporangium phraense]|uniref:Alpha/beta hydrolase n=1 Tax=Cryptosporangium phraense TaxID=2593070 RepID=A0A545ANY9_9ACTN|nr:hypothetical protein [Cryptosporangium phraense]TQS43006.1 hypothetical protein FL583_21455 [Cryptosporangium phraense]
MTRPENEFDGVAEAAAAAGVPTPTVVRRWVNISVGGHLSGVAWGDGPPDAVLVAPPGGQARDLDGVALRLQRPAVVLDLPGAGRSSGPATTPRRAGRAVAEAIASFAPRATVWAGLGEAATTVLAAAARAGRPVGLLLLVDPLLTDEIRPLLESAAGPVAIARTTPDVSAGWIPAVPVTDLDGSPGALAEHLRRSLTVPTA